MNWLSPVSSLLFGLGVGYVMSYGGFGSWSQVQAMLTLSSPRMYVAFATAVCLSVPVWLWVRKHLPRSGLRRVHRGSIVGGVIFGVGWTVTGVCPAVAFVQLGEGKALALMTIAGVLLGNYLYSVAHERWFRWPMNGCADD